MFKFLVVVLLAMLVFPIVTPILIGGSIIATGSFIAEYGVYIVRFAALVFVLWLLNRNKHKIHAFLNREKTNG